MGAAVGTEAWPHNRAPPADRGGSRAAASGPLLKRSHSVPLPSVHEEISDELGQAPAAPSGESRSPCPGCQLASEASPWGRRAGALALREAAVGPLPPTPPGSPWPLGPGVRVHGAAPVGPACPPAPSPSPRRAGPASRKHASSWEAASQVVWPSLWLACPQETLPVPATRRRWAPAPSVAVPSTGWWALWPSCPSRTRSLCSLPGGRLLCGGRLPRGGTRSPPGSLPAHQRHLEVRSGSRSSSFRAGNTLSAAFCRRFTLSCAPGSPVPRVPAHGVPVSLREAACSAPAAQSLSSVLAFAALLCVRPGIPDSTSPSASGSPGPRRATLRVSLSHTSPHVSGRWGGWQVCGTVFSAHFPLPVVSRSTEALKCRSPVRQVFSSVVRAPCVGSCWRDLMFRFG